VLRLQQHDSLDPIAFVSKTGSSAMFIQAMRKALVDQIIQSIAIE